jgi:hypothetical protein
MGIEVTGVVAPSPHDTRGVAVVGHGDGEVASTDAVRVATRSASPVRVGSGSANGAATVCGSGGVVGPVSSAAESLAPVVGGSRTGVG